MRVIGLLFIVVLFSNCKGEDYSQIEVLIKENNSQLLSRNKGSNTSVDMKTGLGISDILKSGTCPDNIDVKYYDSVITGLVISNVNIDVAMNAFDCIESLGFEKEIHYPTMVGLLGLWTDETPAVELFYLRFYKNYKVPDSSLFSLLDMAKYNCAIEASKFLEKDGYPKRYNEIFSLKEYDLFEDYIQKYRCSIK